MVHMMAWEKVFGIRKLCIENLGTKFDFIPGLASLIFWLPFSDHIHQYLYYIVLDRRVRHVRKSCVSILTITHNNFAIHF